MQNNAIFFLAALDVLIGIAALVVGDKNSKLRYFLVLVLLVLLFFIIVIYFLPATPPLPPPTPTPPQETMPTATIQPISIAGKWEGTSIGTNDGNPISERLTTVSIKDNCQAGSICGFFSTEGACVYELTLVETLEDRQFTFDTISVSGADFCYSGSVNNSLPAKLTLTSISNSKINFYYESPSGLLTREGNLNKTE